MDTKLYDLCSFDGPLFSSRKQSRPASEAEIKAAMKVSAMSMELFDEHYTPRQILGSWGAYAPCDGPEMMSTADPSTTICRSEPHKM